MYRGWLKHDQHYVGQGGWGRGLSREIWTHYVLGCRTWVVVGCAGQVGPVDLHE